MFYKLTCTLIVFPSCSITEIEESGTERLSVIIACTLANATAMPLIPCSAVVGKDVSQDQRHICDSSCTGVPKIAPLTTQLLITTGKFITYSLLLPPLSDSPLLGTQTATPV